LTAIGVVFVAGGLAVPQASLADDEALGQSEDPIVIAKQKFEWVRAQKGAIPRGAAESGRDTDGKPLYPCVVRAAGSSIPGKLGRGFGGCNYAYNGKEYTAPQYQVLVVKQRGALKWVDVKGSHLPRSMLKAGDSNGRPLYFCRAAYENSWQIGSVRDGDKACVFGYGGREQSRPKFQVLVRL
jgi:hypothetical protein